MSPPSGLEPLSLAFEVDCEPAHAFDVWTARTSLWWPKSHTVSTESGLHVVFEPRVGGRIFERTSSGVEHDWGRILAWEPPGRIVYEWHLRVDRADATEVEIRFVAAGPATTRVEIEHRGWERLGDGATWRERNKGGWSTLLPHYIGAAGGGQDDIEIEA